MHSESNVEVLLKKDGVEHVDFEDANQEIVSIPSMVEEHQSYRSWSRRLVNTLMGSAVVISQSPGEGNRQHYHPDANEWWYIYDGEYEMTIDKTRKVVIKKGDFVFMKAGQWHHMKAIGDKPAVRIGFSHSMATHTYEGE